MNKLAESKGGKCLSTTYINNKTKLLWECRKKHKWPATPNVIKNGSWCGGCAQKKMSTIDDMKNIAQAHDGLCLSEKYKGNDTKLKWKCSDGHFFNSTPHDIKQGHWCRRCSIIQRAINPPKKLTIDEMRSLAEKRGGKCLSPIYINSRKELLWECKEGHTWPAKPNSIKNGQWCPDCSGHTRLTIDDMHKLAVKFGGKCLSTIYENIDSKLTWQCIDGHEFESRPDDVKYGHWCPRCYQLSRITQEKCRFIFNKLTGKEFIITKKILKYKLELDGYNNELDVAFEYDGQQHNEVSYYNKTHVDLENKKPDY